jgi:hypothetical protein
MVVDRYAPRSVSLRVGDARHAVEALAITGQRASLRGPIAAAAGAIVCVQLDWGDGKTTSLPSRVTSVTSSAGGEPVADVDVCAVEGDWRSFLEYLGPVALAS